MKVALHATLAGIISALLFCLLAGAAPVDGTPSTKLRAVLESELPQQDVKEAQLSSLTHELIRYARRQSADVAINIAIEYDSSVKRRPITRTIPLGSLRSQLDAIAEGAGYTWKANGDWVHLIPKAKVNDPAYIMNRRIPGKVVVSRDPLTATSVQEWLAANKVSASRDIRRTRLTLDASKPPEREDKKWKPLSFTIELENPTLREYAIAHESVYGNDECLFNIQETRNKDGQVERVSVTSWGQCTTPAPTSGSPPKQ